MVKTTLSGKYETCVITFCVICCKGAESGGWPFEMYQHIGAIIFKPSDSTSVHLIMDDSCFESTAATTHRLTQATLIDQIHNKVVHQSQTQL
jgi:hypothetical protein